MPAASPGRHILAAIDFSSRAHRVLRYAGGLARKTGGDLTVVHVIPGPVDASPDDAAWSDLAMQTVKAELEAAGLDAATPVHVLRGGVAEQVGRFACAHGMDLVILAGRAKPGWNGSFLGGTAETILRHTRVPVLLVPAAGQPPAA